MVAARGFNGGELLYLAVAACISNDLYREAATRGINLRNVAVDVEGDFPARGAASTPIEVTLSVTGEAPRRNSKASWTKWIGSPRNPNSIRGTTPVTIARRHIVETDTDRRGGSAAGHDRP